jgi:hypothetical protein
MLVKLVGAETDTAFGHCRRCRLRPPRESSRRRICPTRCARTSHPARQARTPASAVESTSMNASAPPPDSNGTHAASSAITRRCTADSWRTLPWSKARRNDPSVDGARMPPNVAGIAPWRNRSMPSMSSAPATIPAIGDRSSRPGSPRPRHSPEHVGRQSLPNRCSQPAASPAPARHATRDSDHRIARPSTRPHATIALTKCPFSWVIRAATAIMPGQGAHHSQRAPIPRE